MHYRHDLHVKCWYLLSFDLSVVSIYFNNNTLCFNKSVNWPLWWCWAVLDSCSWPTCSCSHGMPHINFTHRKRWRERDRESRHATLLLDSAPVLCWPGSAVPEAVGHWQPVGGQLELLQQMCRCARTNSLKSNEVVPLLFPIHWALISTSSDWERKQRIPNMEL